MVKYICASVLALASCAFAAAEGTDIFPGPEWDTTGLSTLIEFGGGKGNFSSEVALRRALGGDGAKQEIEKLNQQFGGAKVYRFLAVSDYMVDAAWRACSLHHGTKYTPYTGSGFGDWLHVGQDGSYSSAKKWDEALGAGLHSSLMKSVEERFGEGAGENYHTIMDQLATDLKDKL